MKTDIGLFDIPSLYSNPTPKRKRKITPIHIVDAKLQELVKITQEEKVEKIYTVHEFLSYINSFLKPLDATIQGEIGRVTYRDRAVYFSLNDTKEKAVVECLVWRAKLDSMGLELRQGLEVKIIGAPRIYEPTGRFTIEAKYITPVGEGALKLALEKLTKKLELAGYFSPERKKQIPQYVKKLGLITSDGRDAQKDFLTHIGKYGISVYFKDVRVEGIRSIDNIVNAIRWFNENMPDMQVLVVTRGGGSLESLQAFNSEEVAKAIFSSKIPIISAVGHENDVTIADLVADKRASTPTHAGKIISEPWLNALQVIDSHEQHMITVFKACLSDVQKQIETSAESLIYSYSQCIKNKQVQLNNLEDSLKSRMQYIIMKIKRIEDRFMHTFQTFEQSIKVKARQINEKELYLHNESVRWYTFLNKHILKHDELLRSSDPQLKLRQGYSIAADINGKIIKTNDVLKKDDILSIRFYKGGVKASVEEIVK